MGDKMKEIDFITFVSKNSSDYAEFLQKTCNIFKSDDTKINWKCLKSNDDERLPKGYEHVKTVENDIHHSSLNHSMLLNESLNHIQSDYAIIADADIAILYQDWDKLVMDKLDSGLGCFGFSYHDDGPRYKDFPIVFFFCLRKDMLKDVELDFRPKVEKNKESVCRSVIRDRQNAMYFNRPVGYQIKCDTGWQLPLQIRSKGYEGEGIKCVRVNEKGIKLPFRSKKQKKFCLTKPTHMAEWHYDDKLFGTHKQACRSHNLYKSDWGRTWKDRIELYIEDNA